MNPKKELLRSLWVGLRATWGFWGVPDQMAPKIQFRVYRAFRAYLNLP